MKLSELFEAVKMSHTAAANYRTQLIKLARSVDPKNIIHISGPFISNEEDSRGQWYFQGQTQYEPKNGEDAPDILFKILNKLDSAAWAPEEDAIFSMIDRESPNYEVMKAKLIARKSEKIGIQSVSVWSVGDYGEGDPERIPFSSYKASDANFPEGFEFFVLMKPRMEK